MMALPETLAAEGEASSFPGSAWEPTVLPARPAVSEAEPRGQWVTGQSQSPVTRSPAGGVLPLWDARRQPVPASDSLESTLTLLAVDDELTSHHRKGPPTWRSGIPGDWISWIWTRLSRISPAFVCRHAEVRGIGPSATEATVAGMNFRFSCPHPALSPRARGKRPSCSIDFVRQPRRFSNVGVEPHPQIVQCMKGEQFLAQRLDFGIRQVANSPLDFFRQGTTYACQLS